MIKINIYDYNSSNDDNKLKKTEISYPSFSRIICNNSSFNTFSHIDDHWMFEIFRHVAAEMKTIPL